MEDVHYACGCTVEVRLPQDEDARVAMRTHMQSRKCRECDYQEKVQAAQERSEQLGLVPLHGSPRQVAYANLLRSTQVDLFLQEIAWVQWSDETHYEQLCNHLVTTVNALPARWWLEHHELKPLQSLLGDDWKAEG